MLPYLHKIFRFCRSEVVNVYWQNHGQNRYLRLSSHHYLQSMLLASCRTPLKLNTWLICWTNQLPRRVWRYQREVIRIRKSKNRQQQCPKEKVQKDKQRSTKHTYKTKDRVTRAPLKTRGELRCSGSVSSSCPTNQNTLDRYEKLFNTAYSVSKNDPLFSDYTFISAIKIKIYLHLGSNHLDTDVCVNYIKTIPEVFRNDVIDHLKQAQFISIMPDSSTDSCHWPRGNPLKICPPWHSRTSNCVCNYQIFI